MTELSTAQAAPTISAREFRDVVGRLASGVTVITTHDDDQRHGMTASSVTSLSADPPLMIACLNNATPTAAAVGRAGVFVVNVLGERGGELAHRFSTPAEDKFHGVPTTAGRTGAPVLQDALAHLECEVVERIVGGTHTVFIGHVVSAVAHDGHPLTYFRGGFGRFSFARDDEVYHRARDRVLHRVHSAGDVIDVDEMAGALDVDAPAAFYALTRLAADGLVRRDPDRGYVVTAFDTRLSDTTFDARLTIELGVIAGLADALRAGTVDAAAMADLRARFERMAALLVGDRFIDFDAYLDANYAFHEGIVALAGNDLLTSTFGALSIRNVMTRSFGATPVTSERFVEAQRAVLEGLEAGDPDAASAAARSYCELAKSRVREILAHTGGRL
ncbi:flavin reductase [Nocardioides flavescens]|uniref:FCD domain-containing protein n=1 Tax=Nocardioides flavescens TaxID=2691959 RepID=A0A6L7F362_9ACTN|nr:flavin reductase [Nocardioides flavescens]MXG91174.1 FCD domain-containing protein [Nocardioides flavescens]